MAISGDGKITGEAHGETCLAFPPSEPKAGLGRYAEGSLLSGKYRLEGLLGEGGMGAVWRASNVLLDLPVAIKLIRADLDRNALRARLQLEARSVAKLGHPAIVRIYDVGETEFGDPFIVMELLQGATLAQTLVQGRLSAVRAVQLLLPIIDACAVAHARGIVHRDLKPDNLLIALDDQRTQPKVLDFGIAKLTDPRATDLRLTEMGTVVGSPEYMSPEQARGCDDVDYRTDIWSVCVVLYEAITGSAPFSAANYNALLRAIVEQEPSSLFDHAAGDAELWEILKKGLAKPREERQGSMAELGRALGHWLMSHGVHEDACGTSVESKWLARSSDPLMLGEVDPETLRPVSSGFDPKLTHDSRAGANGIDSRGPFTATVRPATARRQRRLRAGVLACTLLAGLTTVFALVSKRLPSATPAHEAALAGRRDSTAPSATNLAPADDPTVTTSVTIAQPVLDKKPEAPPSPSPRARASSKPAALGARVAPNVRAATASRTVVAPSPTGSANAPAKSSHRDLDLISPY
jgi:serine/threonine protein kinase